MPVRGLLSRFLDGEVTVDQLLDRIRQREPQLHCWAEFKPEPEPVEGVLRGAPYGLKDIFDAAGYHTSFGSALYSDNLSTSDSPIVTMLRKAGARLMGKTHTTAFAYYDPAPTRNPHQPLHTPGGSSSGSAAAVASGMVPFAVGSQTQGSVLRPASFCGIAGFKPTRGVLPLAGALPFAPTLDTAGLFTQTAIDMRLLWGALGFAIDAETPSSFALVEFEVEPDMQTTFRQAIQTLGALGQRIKRIAVPESFSHLGDAVSVINSYEGARTHERRYQTYGTAIGVKLAELVREGLAIEEDRYRSAIAVVETARREMGELFESFPVLLSQAAPGPAPYGLASTGNPRCNAPWTALGVPAITIPMPVPEGLLPMGLQLAAAANQERTLFAAACHFEALLNSSVSVSAA